MSGGGGQTRRQTLRIDNPLKTNLNNFCVNFSSGNFLRIGVILDDLLRSFGHKMANADGTMGTSGASSAKA